MRQVDSAVPGVIERDDTGIVRVFLVLVVIGQVAFVVGINYVPVARIRDDETAFAAAGLKPILGRDDPGIRPAGDADIGVVLLGAIDVIRERVVDRDVIKLRGRLIVLRRPGLAAIGRNCDTAVVRV